MKKNCFVIKPALGEGTWLGRDGAGILVETNVPDSASEGCSQRVGVVVSGIFFKPLTPLLQVSGNREAVAAVAFLVTGKQWLRGAAVISELLKVCLRAHFKIGVILNGFIFSYFYEEFNLITESFENREKENSSPNLTRLLAVLRMP